MKVLIQPTRAKPTKRYNYRKAETGAIRCEECRGWEEEIVEEECPTCGHIELCTTYLVCGVQEGDVDEWMTCDHAYTKGK